MGKTTELRRAVKRTFHPFVIAKGFTVDMRKAPDFFTYRKITSKAIFVFDIQWAENGLPRFFVNFGRCGPDGIVWDGRRTTPTDVFTWSCDEGGRLSAGGDFGWFRQDRTLLARLFKWSKLYPADEVVAQPVSLLPEVEDYWDSRTVGPHIRLLPPFHPRIKSP